MLIDLNIIFPLLYQIDKQLMHIYNKFIIYIKKSDNETMIESNSCLSGLS